MDVGYSRNVRARHNTGAAAPDTNRRRKIAQAISARLRAKFPYKDYGAAYYQRGSPASLATFGQSYRGATEPQRVNRRNSGFSGRGAYWGKAAGGFLGRAGAGMLATAVGMPELAPLASNIGGRIGSMAGDFLSDKVMHHLRGRGAYTTHALVNNHAMVPDRVVNTVNGETGDIIFSHSEYIQDITPTTANFQTQYFQAMNPGLSGFAPWLAQIAGYFEEYELIQCVYTFKSMVTEGNGTAAGTVVMATQYNPTNQPFTAKQSMENYEYANSCKVTDNLVHGVECDPNKHGGPSVEYIRTGAVPTGQDPKTYDLAVVQVATSGCVANLNLGELWVHYRVRLSKAKIVLPGGFPNPNDILVASVRLVQPAGTPTLDNLLGVLTGNYWSNFTQSGSTPSDPSGAMTLGTVGQLVAAGPPGIGNTIGFPTYVNGGRYMVCLEFALPTTSSFGGIAWVGYQCNVLRWEVTPNTGAAGQVTYKAVAMIDIVSVTGTQATIKIVPTNANTPIAGTIVLSVFQIAANANPTAYFYSATQI